LGALAWPRARDSGAPLTHVASIDLAHLHERAPRAPLPHRGALAFFLLALADGYECAVLHVLQNDGADTEVPADAPPAFTPYGEALPFDATVGARAFPRGPIEITALVSENPDEEEDLAPVVERHVNRRQFFFDASSARKALGDTPLPTYWASGRHLAACLEAAVPRLDTLRASKARYSNSAETLAAFDAGRAAFIAFVADVQRWVGQHAAWNEMTSGETEELKSLLARAKGEFGAYAKVYTPNALRDLETAGLRALASAEDSTAWLALPAPVRDLIDSDYRLPSSSWHQMFGQGVDIQGTAVDEHRDDVLLLQLVYDDLMEWRFGDMGAFQFWISNDDLLNARWSRVVVTFEAH
jgi:hypothetical protein